MLRPFVAPAASRGLCLGLRLRCPPILRGRAFSGREEVRELDPHGPKGLTESTPSTSSAITSFTGGLPASRDFDLRQSFRKFPLHRDVQLGLMKMGVSVPTRVQDLTMPMLMEGVSTFILAQTGTGKTLAYVLPLVHKLLSTNAEGFFPKSRKPRAIIVQPTRELALQTIKVVRNFPVRSVVCAPSCFFVKETQALFAGVDVVVTTPFRLILHLGKADMVLNEVRHVVFDEADTLCDTFYEKDTSKVLKGLEEDCPTKPQVIIVGATRTGAVSAFLRKHMNNTQVMPVVTTDAHVPPPHLEQVFVPTRGKRLLSVLWDVLGEVPTVGKKTLIFTNRAPTCKAVHKSLLEHGMNAVCLHGNVHPDKRKQAWDSFAGGGKADVMVCTNLASRGLDFSNVHHVVMYDFPLNMADYLHRVGRTARGGRAGRVTTITPRRYWPFVSKIQEATKQGKPIEVRNMSKKVKKILAIENYQKVLQSRDVKKSVKQKLKQRLGLPPARNIGSKETKAAMKRLDRRMKAIKHVRYLWKRGILKRGHKIPQMPDKQVEASETQTVSTLVRARDGLLQVVPNRRRQNRGADRPENVWHTDRHRRLLQEKLLPKGARMILDHVSDGRSSCGFTWHIQQEGVGTGQRGLCFLRLNSSGEVAYVRELGEPLFKAGVLTEQLLQALTKDQPKKLRAASSTTQTPTTAPGIVKYLYGDVQESGGDAVRFYADDVVYEDMNYDTPFVGKTAVEGFLNRFQDIEGVTFVLEEVSDGEKAVGFTYHIDVAGQPRGIRGVTFYEIDDKGKVKYVRDVPESATKPPPVQQVPLQMEAV
ncbi:unnamed protein product [Symbiodinium microadriaticum]|nr:unnamed protein product [Symbiodinium microadriaticum]